jgi:hypothetical protein
LDGYFRIQLETVNVKTLKKIKDGNAKLPFLGRICREVILV